MRRWIWRLVPLAMIIALMILAYVFGITDYLSFEVLQQRHHQVTAWVEEHYIAAPLAFIGIYIVLTGLSIPGAIYLTLAGGFLFAQPESTVYVVVGATIGASIIFLIAKTAIGDALRERASPYLKRMKVGFEKDQASYLLFLRFVPIFPFWLINIAPAFFGVAMWTFIWTTFVGVIPSSFVFAQAGTGLGAIFESDEGFTLNAILNRDVKIALLALGVVSLIPIGVRYIKKQRNGRGTSD